MTKIVTPQVSTEHDHRSTDRTTYRSANLLTDHAQLQLMILHYTDE